MNDVIIYIDYFYLHLLGWSKAWKINFWARLHDGNHAYLLLQSILKGSSTLPNLLHNDPTFQIDGFLTLFLY
jgi:hypothetical protein